MADVVVVAGADLPGELAIVPRDAALSTKGFVATAGSWERSSNPGGDVARFTPRFAPAPGSVYLIVTRTSAGDSWTECARVLVGGELAARSAVVVGIEPNVDAVPANLLRFAVTFSAEMEEGAASSHVHLLDSRGAEVAGALYDLPPELWDRSRRRLTVLLEPGRIKRGLQPNTQAGAPLVEGETVTFTVGAGVRDARGAELASGASHVYRVGSPIRSRVDPARWQVRWPAHAEGSLAVLFERPLDRALALRCLRLLGRNGHPVPGEVTLNADATQWMFVPEAARASRTGEAEWPDWRLHVDTRLEDLAGNSIRRVFDRDLEQRDDSIDQTEIVLAPPVTSAQR